LSYGAVHLTIHPCSKLQGILAKANKKARKVFSQFPEQNAFVAFFNGKTTADNLEKGCSLNGLYILSVCCNKFD
jgi:hypothetical protein